MRVERSSQPQARLSSQKKSPPTEPEKGEKRTFPLSWKTSLSACFLAADHRLAASCMSDGLFLASATIRVLLYPNGSL